MATLCLPIAVATSISIWSALHMRYGDSARVALRAYPTGLITPLCGEQVGQGLDKKTFQKDLSFSVHTFRLSDTLKPISNAGWTSGRLDTFAESDWSGLAHHHTTKPNPTHPQIKP